MTRNSNTDNLTIILYDGECHLCDGCVQFVIAKERDVELTKAIRFCHLQSLKAEALLAPFDEDIQMDTLYLIEHGKLYRRSTAVLRIARYLRRPWSWARVFIVFPAPLRDWFYDVVGRRRYRWFGRSDTCILPVRVEPSRFLNDA